LIKQKALQARDELIGRRYVLPLLGKLYQLGADTFIRSVVEAAMQVLARSRQAAM
jgi:hypothetical protein